MKSILGVFLFAWFIAGCSTTRISAVDESETSMLIPQPPTAEEDSLVDIGIGLHDKGNYNGAVDVYKVILKMNPSNIVALYEMSFSLLSEKEYGEAIRYASEGRKYKSKYHSLFYMTMASAMDHSGKVEEAVAAYHKGFTLDPDNHLFPYNLAITYLRHHQLDSARFYFHAALVLNPNHPGSNLGLANTYEAMHKPIPQLFALSRFLIIEPATKRSVDALKSLKGVLSQSVSSDESKSKNISITVSPDSDAVDGDMTTLGLLLSLAEAGRFVDTVKAKTEMEGTVKIFKTLFQVMDEMNQKQLSPGFCWNYYAPYYIDLQHRGLTEAFVYWIFRSSGSPAVRTWFNDNPDRAKEFIEWNKLYNW